MKKEKGFTLIELLAVIVILAILMVIAVPKILNVINKSKESSADSSIKLVKDAIKTQVTSGDIIGTLFTKDNDDCYTFNFDDQENGNVKELKLKNKEKITGTIKYCNGKFTDDTLNFDGNRVIPPKIICKRANELHISGSHTFGSLGTNETLSSGDAFDCDVNGDGIYDSETERFYYVSDYYNTNTKEFENDTAVLIYYNNVSSGTPSNSKTYAYDKSGKNNNGPVTAIVQLPTLEQWNNVNLKNDLRAILNENEESITKGGTLPSNFSYSGYAARLLTVQEVNKACNIIIKSAVNELKNCNFLMENTRYSNSSIYGYWLETVYSSSSSNGWPVNGFNAYVGKDPVSAGFYGIRPVIEVPKINIEY